MTASTESRSAKPKKRDYFGKEIKALKITGVAIRGGDSVAYKTYSFLYFAVIHCLYPVIDFAEVFKHDFEVASDMMSYMFAAFLSLAKSLVVFQNRKIIGTMLSRLEEEPFIANIERGGDREQKLLDECIWITNIQTLIYWTSAIITMSSTIVYTFILRLKSSDYHDWRLAYGPLTVLNITYSPYYEITWVYQNISILTIGWNFATIDVLTSAVLAHISVQFKILQNNLRRIVTNSYKDMCKDNTIQISSLIDDDSGIDGSEIPWSYLHKSLKVAVDYHLAILDIASAMEKVFSKLLLIVFLGVLGMLSFLILRMSMIHNPAQIIRYLGETASACLAVATVCYWGEQIMFESQNVGIAAFESNFQGTDLRFQKGLQLIIRRSQNPTKLTAGKFADICLATFKWILRTAYSSFMVLRTSNSNP